MKLYHTWQRKALETPVVWWKSTVKSSDNAPLLSPVSDYVQSSHTKQNQNWLCVSLCVWNYLIGLMVRASPSRAADFCSIPTFGVDLFLGWHISVTFKLVIQWLPCQAPGVCFRVSAGSGRPCVSILWLGEQIWSATSISVWQHIQLSEQIHSWVTLACYWDISQPKDKSLCVCVCYGAIEHVLACFCHIALVCVSVCVDARTAHHLESVQPIWSSTTCKREIGLLSLFLTEQTQWIAEI